MQRIMIIGAPGSGKSTLARTLGARLGLLVYHMDREVHWLPGWEERSRDEKARISRSIIAREEWIYEGGHSSTFEERAARADLLIWLDLPLGLRLLRVVRRTLRDRGRTRPDMQDGCPERIDMLPEFIGFIWRTRHSARKRQSAVYAEATCAKAHLRSQRQIDAYLATFCA